MSLFTLHQRVMEEYEQFVHSFVQIADARVRAYAEQVIRDERALWPAPMLQLSPAYQYGVTLDALVQQGVLHPDTGRIFRTRTGEPLRLYAHQERALRLASHGRSYVVTSGTGSGKSFTYLIPIIDYLLRHPDERGHVVALILYPMNALVNSQLRALESLREQYGQRFPITFAKYTGETLREQREQMRQQPPQILLTNYMMGELLMVRREDQPLFGQRTLRFLVFDELHTYRGRQGADVAMLVRRLKERYGAPDLVHIGTSATMVASEDATQAERRQAVAQFAASFFGHPFDADTVVDEVLAPATEGGEPTDAELHAVWGQPFPDTLDDLRRHPLARWIEWTFGLERDAAGNLRRRTPRTLREACESLAQRLGQTPDACEQWVQSFLDHLERVRQAGDPPLFAFKLHQFISQSRPLHATLEPPDQRRFSLVALPADESGALYIPLYFCRHCGQDYYRVMRDDSSLVGISMDESPDDEEATLGYLTFADWSTEQIPDEWYDPSGRLKRNWRDRVPQQVWVSADGEWSMGEREGACAMWWQPAPFALCLRCGEWYDRRVSERTKLVGLSSEGRSSATTVLALAQLRHAEPTGGARPKLLSFTDNRQDASLQAGHFNDFVRIALLRAALVAALEQHNCLRYDEVAARVVEHSGLSLRDIASQPDLAPNTPAANRVWATFGDLTEYRLYEDLRREWRYTQPNLETLGLLRIEYEGLRELCNDESAWACLEPFARLTPDAREGVLRAVLDLFRHKFALNAESLKAEKLRELSKRCTQELNEHWGIDPDADDLIEARVLVLERVDERLPAPVGALLSARSKIGRYLRQQLGIRADEYDALIPQLLQQLTAHGLLARVPGAVPMYQLNVASLMWCRGDGTPQVSTLDCTERTAATQVNPFFTDVYRAQPSQLAGLEAREHTAQVVERGERERRERRFSGDLRGATAALPCLLAHDGAGHRHRRLRPCASAQCAPDARQLRPAQRTRWTSRATWADCDLLRRVELSRPILFRAPCRDGGGRGARPAPRLGQREPATRPPARPLAQRNRAAAGQKHRACHRHRSVPQPAAAERSVGEQIHRQTDAAKERLRTRYQEIIATLPERPRWLTDAWLQQAIAEIPERFDRAFDRWRELYRAVEEQMSRAERQRRSARDRDTQEAARRAYEEAERQRNLLLQIGVEYEESDFYPYRYLASEGFLPGYNFPTLPLRAWAPRKDGEFISRPRALALREFAPQSIIYHEGNKWEVWTLMTPLGGVQQRVSQKKLCAHCDAYAENDHDVCPVCQQPLDASNSQWVQVFEMCNVKLRRRERIHSGEEERLRKGYSHDPALPAAACGRAAPRSGCVDRRPEGLPPHGADGEPDAPQSRLAQSRRGGIPHRRRHGRVRERERVGARDPRRRAAHAPPDARPPDDAGGVPRAVPAPV
jgi:hypothetical protein